MNIWIITGTDTEIGKTMTTAALAALLRARGRRVAIDKPAQTGMTGPKELGDAALAKHLSGAAHASEGVRLIAPLAPVRAALEEGTTLPGPAAHASRIRALDFDDVLVEGSGGLLVELAPDWDIADLACDLANTHLVRVVVTVRAGLGTLNHTGLTLRELARRGITAPGGATGGRPTRAGLVIGSWPQAPGLAEQTNLAELAALAPILGRLPAGLGEWTPERLAAHADRLLPNLAKATP